MKNMNLIDYNTTLFPIKKNNFFISLQVMWLRSSDLQILTVGDITFTQDSRFHIDHTDDDSWGLIIKNADHKDAGRYECQINTDPKMKRYVNLVVKGKRIVYVVNELIDQFKRHLF